MTDARFAMWKRAAQGPLNQPSEAADASVRLYLLQKWPSRDGTILLRMATRGIDACLHRFRGTQLAREVERDDLSLCGWSDSWPSFDPDLQGKRPNDDHHFAYTAFDD